MAGNLLEAIAVVMMYKCEHFGYILQHLVCEKEYRVIAMRLSTAQIIQMEAGQSEANRRTSLFRMVFCTTYARGSGSLGCARPHCSYREYIFII